MNLSMYSLTDIRLMYILTPQNEYEWIKELNIFSLSYVLSNCLEFYKLRSCLKNINAEARKTVQILKNNHFLECFAVLYFFQHFYDHLYTAKIYEQTLYRLLCEWRKKPVKIAVLCIFAHDVLCTFVLDGFETSNLESFNMYFHKGGSKESQNKNIMYACSRLKKNWSILKLATM